MWPSIDSGPDLELSVLVACRDDEERAGHVIRRVAEHLRALGVRAEILAVDEGSADNTLPLCALLARELPELRVIAGADVGRAFVRGAQVARGHALLLLDARTDPPLVAIAHALGRLAGDRTALALAGGHLLLHRTRTLKLHRSLVHHRDPRALARRVLFLARLRRLAVDEAALPCRDGLLSRLRASLRAHPRF